MATHYEAVTTIRSSPRYAAERLFAKDARFAALARSPKRRLWSKALSIAAFSSWVMLVSSYSFLEFLAQGIRNLPAAARPGQRHNASIQAYAGNR